MTARKAPARRWPTTLFAALLLFLFNWGIWAFNVIVLRRWSLTPIEQSLLEVEKGSSVGMARLIASLVCIFLIVLAMRIYLYLLLLEHDYSIGASLFRNTQRWRLRLEFWIRCVAVIAVNFIYYSSTGRVQHFQFILTLTALAVFLWDLIMIDRLRSIVQFRGVFHRDFFLLVICLVYYFLDRDKIAIVVSPIPFFVMTGAAVAIFWSEMTSTYWSLIGRVCRSRSLVG